jgi:hypothetical protein
MCMHVSVRMHIGVYVCDSMNYRDEKIGTSQWCLHMDVYEYCLHVC